MTTDIIVTDHGSVVQLTPCTDAGREWCRENLGADCPSLGHTLIVEHRYAADILEGMIADGITLGGGQC